MARKRKRFRLSKLRIILLLILVYIVMTLLNQRTLMKNLKNKKELHNKEIQAIEREIAKLEREIENSSSLEFVEKVAREELGMVKPREIIFIDKNKKKSNFLSPLKEDNWLTLKAI